MFADRRQQRTFRAGRYRTLIGLLVAPLSVGVLFPCLLAAYTATYWYEITSLTAFLVFCGIAYVAGLLVTIVAFAPLHKLLLHHGQTSAWSYVGAGFSPGLLATVISIAAAKLSAEPDDMAFPGFLGGIPALGGISIAPMLIMAWIFWLIRRPDRSPTRALLAEFD